MIALIGNLDSIELVIVLVAAILIFGRRLPQVAAEAGSQLGKLRRSLDTAWKESGADKEVREMQRSIESIRDAVPRDLSAGSMARLAANEFQRRVESQQGTEEGLATRPATALGAPDTHEVGAATAPHADVSTTPPPLAPAATVARGVDPAAHASPGPSASEPAASDARDTERQH